MTMKVAAYVDEDMHQRIVILAERHHTSVSRLVLAAIEDTYEDNLDAIAGEIGMTERLSDPSSTIDWSELKRQLRKSKR